VTLLSVERIVARDRWIVGACIAVIAALAWLWLWRAGAAMNGVDPAMVGMDMPGMDALMSSASGWAYLGAAFAMWLLMMVAMMLPSATPMILTYGRLARGARAQGAAMAPTALFAAVYLGVWGVFSAAAALAQWGLVRSGTVSQMDLSFGDRRIGGALLILAGLYQATPLKRACLESCRSPMSFLMRLWRPGYAGALRLGFRHGLYCLGCCAALMALLFVFGVMNLGWVAALAAFVLLEKVLPLGARFALAAGALAVVVGLTMVFDVHPYNLMIAHRRG
jgi:predicted metal-binding membrane protein